MRKAEAAERNLFLVVLAWAGKIIGTLLLVAVTTGVILAFIFAIYTKSYLQVDLDVDVEDFTIDQTSFIYVYDKDMQDWVMYDELYSTINRTWVPYEELPPYIFDALVAIEDKRFWDHNGVDWYRTAGAVFTMFLGDGGSFGASTITQQVVRNLTGDKEVTVRRKLNEIFRALDFAQRNSREDVLELYINLVYFGQGAYGIQAAAQVYFGKDARDLTMAEAASIIGITNLPTYYDPYQYRENNTKRQKDILFVMKEEGYITEEERAAASAEKLRFKRDAITDSEQSTSVQNYYVDQVIEDVIGDLMKSKGISRQLATRMLYSGGLQIYILMDEDVQGAIDEVYTNPDYWPTIRNAEKLAEEGIFPQSAIVVMDPYTGNILGMAGGLGEKTINRASNRATMSTRQPGSSIKPISVYAPALDSGLVMPYSVMTDMPAMLMGGAAYPKNYDLYSAGWRGQMTIREAVQRSNNSIPVQLINTMTPQHCFDFAKYKMGLSTLVEETYIGGQKHSDIDISCMSLGGLTNGVTVLDMTAAYSVFPNQGVYNTPRTYSHILDSNGTMVLDNQREGVAVIKESTAFYMNTLLTNVVATSPGTGVYARLENSIAAGKTGTTDDDFDRWFAGYTPYYAATVWYGFDYNRTIESTTSPAVPLWKAVMDKLHAGLEPRQFFTPAQGDVVHVTVCLDSGMLATEACRADVRGSRAQTWNVLSENRPTVGCTMHQYVDIDTESGMFATEFCPVEQIERKSLLKLDRYFALPAVLNDEKYTIREGDLSLQDADGHYRVSIAEKDLETAPAMPCHLHAGPLEPEFPPEDDDGTAEPEQEPDNPDSFEPAEPDSQV